MASIPASVRSILLPDETLIFGTTLHWVIYVRGLFVTMLGLALSMGAQPIIGYFVGRETLDAMTRPIAWLVMGVTLLGCFLLVTAFIRQASVVLLVTNHRVVAKFGLIARATVEMFLSKVEGANVAQSITGRILGYGSIIIKGVGDNFLPIADIADPEKFQTALMGQITKDQTNR